MLQPDQTFKFACLNDKIDHSLASAEIVENDVKVNFYEKLFPNMSKFEIGYNGEEPSTSIRTTTTEESVEATTQVEETLTYETTSKATEVTEGNKKETEIVVKKNEYKTDIHSDQYENSVIVDDYSCQIRNWYSVIAMYLCGTTVFILLLLKLKRYSLLKL